MKKRKLEFVFTLKALKFLDNLVRRTGTCRAVVIRNALRVYEFFLRKKEEGYKIKLIKSDDPEDPNDSDFISF